MATLVEKEDATPPHTPVAPGFQEIWSLRARLNLAKSGRRTIQISLTGQPADRTFVLPNTKRHAPTWSDFAAWEGKQKRPLAVSMPRDIGVILDPPLPQHNVG